ncbi:hypothetical protein [Flavobacterium sedimenticola]|uniref:Lipoprotein n=1 Tax=Flavobacterium sedimenticola TaxID=3043286 RepID=A0ABT6XN05_9FLAO|nr:hypothetical protein [Flavobacterium sedimenticola]MDI9256469.1 hypothetical protein [Flavobacterium sedimenticola]
MKKAHSLVLLFVLAVLTVSCSSDSGSGGGGDSFTYVYDGNNVNIIDVTAQKVENSLVVSGTAANGQSIEFNFNKFGDLGTVSSFSVSDFDFPDTETYQNFSGHYFTFNLISIDETNKRVHVSFSGNLYEEFDNLNSNSVPVSGEFEVTYIETQPNVAGLGVDCKIAGENWYSTNSYTNNGYSIDDFILRELSDDENRISIGFDATNNNPGTYNFTAASTTNFVKLSKFNTASVDFTDYNCAGTLTVTNKTSAGFIGYIIEGTYSFTATNPSNPSQVIQVTNGRFKTFYSW